MRTDDFPADSELALAESNGKLYLLGGYMEGDLTWPAVGRLVPAAFVGQIQLANQVESRPNEPIVIRWAARRLQAMQPEPELLRPLARHRAAERGAAVDHGP